MMLGPIFNSAMKRRMRSYRAPLLLTAYGMFVLLVSSGAVMTLQKSELTLGNLRMGLETYIYLSVMQFFLIVMVAPALTAGSIAGERERQTLDLLLCTRTGAMRIVFGKLLSNVCFIALMVISSLPAMAVTLFFGGVTLPEMLYMLLFLIVTALACSSVGIFCSAVFKRTVTATVVSYLTIFAIGAGTLFIALLQIGRGTLLSDVIYSSSSYGYSVVSSSSVAYISSGGSVPTAVSGTMQTLSLLPKYLLINPAVGLFTTLVEQTGLLRNTFENYLGGVGYQLFSFFDVIGSVASLNMITLALLSLLLSALAALFVKPSGLKAKKKK